MADRTGRSRGVDGTPLSSSFGDRFLRMVVWRGDCCPTANPLLEAAKGFEPERTPFGVWPILVLWWREGARASEPIARKPQAQNANATSVAKFCHEAAAAAVPIVFVLLIVIVVIEDGVMLLVFVVGRFAKIAF